MGGLIFGIEGDLNRSQMKHASGMFLSPVQKLAATSIFFCKKQKKMQIKSLTLHKRALCKI